MVRYIKTEADPEEVEDYARYYAETYLHSRPDPDVEEALESVYGMKIVDIRDAVARGFKVSETDVPHVLAIYVDDHVYVKGWRLADIVDFLEYGNLEFPKIGFASEMFDYALFWTSEAIGGY